MSKKSKKPAWLNQPREMFCWRDHWDWLTKEQALKKYVNEDIYSVTPKYLKKYSTDICTWYLYNNNIILQVMQLQPFEDEPNFYMYKVLDELTQ